VETGDPSRLRVVSDAVLAEALALGDTQGFEAVTIRGVADSLGVTPMALYRHVGDKERLLDGLADALYAELRIPDPSDDWWEGLAGLARSTRAVLLEHPWAVPLFSRPVAGPHALALGSALVAALRTAGLSGREVTELHDQLSNMVFALVRPELGGRRNGPPSSAVSNSCATVSPPACVDGQFATVSVAFDDNAARGTS
jgi:AcrR family transcriptional regulator